MNIIVCTGTFYKTELPQVLSFFGGTRFVPIVSTVTYLIVGIIMFYLWPVVQLGISKLGVLVLNSGYAGTWIYGILERALIPFGLHHVFYMPFWQTAVGGRELVNGQLIEGAQNIFFAELASPDTSHFSVAATRFMSGKFPLMMFGLPGAALAMYTCARPENKKAVGSLLLSAAISSAVTGITEPLEFAFLFVAPPLYVIHCAFAGLSYMLMHMLNVGIGMTFSGGFLDFFLFGILQGNEKTSWMRVIPVGIIYFFLYYFIFKFMIKKFNFKTPGREDDDTETKLYTKADVNARKEAQKGENTEAGADPVSEAITRGLGGKKNISDVDCCATRLRCTVKDAALVNDGVLKATGASGVVHKGQGVQVIYGPNVTVIKSNLEDYLETAPDTLETPAAEPQVQETETPKEEAGQKVVDRIVISSPISGTAADLVTAPDEAFAQKMMGDGIAIKPNDDKIYSPCDGTVEVVFEGSEHAIGIVMDNGLQVMIHCGLNTVNLTGICSSKVKKGDKVKAGQLIMTFDREKLKEENCDDITMLVVLDQGEAKSITFVGDQNVVANETEIAQIA